MEDKQTRRFTKPSLISKHLYCIICNYPFQDPQRLHCGHTFCLDCILTWLKSNKTCPQCRARFNRKQVSRDLIAYNLINEFEVRCNFKGCAWTGPLESLESHGKSCKFHPDRVDDWVLNHLPDSQECKSDEDIDAPNESLLARLYSQNPELLKSIMNSDKTVRYGDTFYPSTSDDETMSPCLKRLLPLYDSESKSKKFKLSDG